mgnify:CR=1 FL=1
MIAVLIHINFLIMKKQILNIGKVLNKVEQKVINGGRPNECTSNGECPPGGWCCNPHTELCEAQSGHPGGYCW